MPIHPRPLVLALGAPIAFAALAAAPSQAAAPVVASVISFTETYGETPNAEGGHFRIDARIPLDPADVAAFDASTTFDVWVGWFDFYAELGDDPEWKPGARTATLVEEAWDGSGRVLVAKLRWTPTQLIVRVTAETGDDIDPIVSDDYLEDDTGAIADETDAEIEFGNTDVWWDTVPCEGRVVTRESRGDIWSSVRMRGHASQ